MTSAPVLRLPDFQLPMHIWPDASGVAIGGLLTQDDGGGHRPIAFLSKKLSAAERNYPTIERELFAIVHCLRTWRCYVDGLPVVVHTDHKPLTWAKSITNPKPRLWGWLQEMESFSPEVLYQPGREQPADSLSRLTCNSLELVVYRPKFEPPSGSLSMLEIENSFKTDWPSRVLSYLRDEELWNEGLSNLQSDIIRRQAPNFVLHGQTLFRKISIEGRTYHAAYVSPEDRISLVRQYHEVLGHLAVNNVFQVMRKRVYWPRLESDIKSVLLDCRKCQLCSSGPARIAPLNPFDAVPLPFHTWGVDFIQDLPKSRDGYTQILTLVDYATDFFIAIPTKDRLAKTVAHHLYHSVVMRYGPPYVLVSDLSNSFSNEILHQYLALLETHHLPSTPYHPQTNGKLERVHGILKPILRKLCARIEDKWDYFLPQAVFVINCRKHSVHGYSPFYLMHGVEPRLPGDIDSPIGKYDFSNEIDRDEYTSRVLDTLGQARAARYFRVERNAKIMKSKYDNARDTQSMKFKIGEFVMRRNASQKGLEYPWYGPYIVVDVSDTGLTYRLMLPNGQALETPIHANDLRTYKSADSSQYYHSSRIQEVS